MSTTISISDWRPRRSGALRGFVSATMPSGIVIHEIGIFAKSGQTWATPPSKPLVDRDGRPMLDASGKRRYAESLAFTSAEIKSRWSEAIVAALVAAHPEALADD